MNHNTYYTGESMCYTTEMQLAKLAESTAPRAWELRNARGRLVRLEPFDCAEDAQVYARAWNDAVLMEGRAENIISEIVRPSGARIGVDIHGYRRYSA